MEICEIIEGLKRIENETGSLMCLGCKHKRNCAVHGCAIIVAARQELKRLAGERRDILALLARTGADELCGICANLREPEDCPENAGDCGDCAADCACRGCVGVGNYRWRGNAPSARFDALAADGRRAETAPGADSGSEGGRRHDEK